MVAPSTLGRYSPVNRWLKSYARKSGRRLRPPTAGQGISRCGMVPVASSPARIEPVGWQSISNRRGASKPSSNVIAKAPGAFQSSVLRDELPHRSPGAKGRPGKGVRQLLCHPEIAVLGITEKYVVASVAGEQHGGICLHQFGNS